jgi:CHAT domain-containing protein
MPAAARKTRMPPRRYRIRGTVHEQAAPRSDDIVIVASRRLLPGSARDGIAGELEVAGDEVVRVELDNGFVLWTSAAELVREHGRPALARDGGEAWEFGALVPRRAGDGGERGIVGLGIRILDFFGIDLAGKAARELARRFEERLLQGRTPGLFACEMGDAFALTPAPAADAIAAGEGPLLVLLHGTASSCAGSFGKLWAPGNGAGKALREQLRQRHGPRTFAFEHRTLTDSPLANALELARSLPAGATLHLVSHSRGGLVGELLCLGERITEDGDPLSDDTIATLFAADRIIAEQLGLSPLAADAARERDAAYAADRARLVELRELLAAKRLRVQRFVRVACPARGTTLASGRLDRWLSMLDFLVGKVAGAGLFAGGVDLLAAVAKERTDPRTLPGLEAMMPGSALTRLLHHPSLATRADLSVIAGDIEGESLWQRLKLVATDWFFAADHDLVVNTASMTGGLRRPADAARFLRDQGADVNHFSYFHNPRSVRWLAAALGREDGADGGFLPIAAAAPDPPAWRAAVARSRSTTVARPLAVVLPGTMGSQLSVDGKPVWLDYRALLLGGLRRLAIERRDVEAVGLVDRFYGPLLEFLARTHRVEIFAYDWRRSVRAAATALAKRLEDLLPECERQRQPVHLVAHSMGGLVVRAMIADGERGAKAWRRITQLPNSRLMMLGTPNHGSYEALRWLTGFNPTQAKLALLDLTQDTRQIIDLVRRFPGLLELLPFAPQDPDFGTPAPWQAIRQQTAARWSIADGDDLRAARQTWNRLLETPAAPTHMVYVAGSQPATVVDYALIDAESPFLAGRKRLAFVATREGDGTVSWASGALPGVRTWYVADTAHDQLCAQRRALPAYLDLLMNGDTTLLPTAPPLRAREAAVERFMLAPVPPADGIPDEAELATAGFGGASPPPQPSDARPAAPTIELGLRHGDLAYARHAVLVGHYHGDTIVSAEAALDRRLGGALSRRLQLGLYPGALGTHAVFLNEKPLDRPPGTVVVGLGQVGQLSPGLLEAGARAAMLEFALQVAQWPDPRFGSALPRSAALSCLLVGTGAGGMPARDALEALLRAAVAANMRLQQSALDDKVLIDRIEFIELFEDVALSAAAALEQVLASGELAAAVRWPAPVVDSGEGGHRRARFDEAPEWWHRLEITEQTQPEGLRFNFATDRARSEQTLATGQLALAESFIGEASRSPRANREAAHTLFEMLLPLRLKEMGPGQGNLVLVVDARSARYPWELLEDRWSQDGRPPAVAAGLVRQLATPTFRARPAHALAAAAFVVGNPDLGGGSRFADLPGAREEAQRVAALLGSGGFRVTACIDARTDTIMQGLHRDAYRILHLAGHGEHGYTLPAHAAADGDAAQCPPAVGKVSGMIIGRDTLLTAGDIEQMRWVPELVFLNCCHLGRTRPDDGADRGALAANLAVQFIRMGVRAVIAAGWAVDDAAATAFAEAFYARMLAGEAFGEAVRAAREEVWLRFPDCNTWGAYQCYGDQSLRLRGGSNRPAPAATTLHGPAEVVAAFDNLARTVQMRRRDDANALGQEDFAAQVTALIARIPEACRAAWLQRGDVCAAIGLAWGEARQWAQAIEWLERALAAARGSCPLRIVEQCANYQVRLAGDEWLALRPELAAALIAREAAAQALQSARSKAAKELHAAELERCERTVAALRQQQAELVERIERAIRELDILCQRAATAERLNLLGGACKRLAMVQAEPIQQTEALVNMANYYRQALDIAGGRDAYAFTNWACAQLLAARRGRGPQDDWRARLERDVAAIGEASAALATREPSFWNDVTAADCLLVRLLAIEPGRAGETAPSDAEALADDIIAGYHRALRRGASPRERSSLLEHLSFLIELAGDAPAGLHAALVRIRDTLQR